jgi:hypothetical protein
VIDHPLLDFLLFDLLDFLVDVIDG